MKIWECKIGEFGGRLPAGADLPMRNAVAEAFERLTGEAPKFIFSGWGAKLNEYELAVVEDREPVPAPEIPPAPVGLRNAIMTAINTHSAENGSNTSDFILAEFLMGSLAAFDAAVNTRERWYGREVQTDFSPAPAPVPAELSEPDEDGIVDIRVTGGGSVETPLPFGEA